MDTTLCQFGETHFGQAQLGDRRATKRLVYSADRCVAQPDGSLPDKFADPADLAGLYRLVNRAKTTHDAVISTHVQRSRQAIRDHDDPVILIAHDDTDLDYSNRHALKGELGPISGKHQRGLICHNSLAISTAGEPLGIVNQILHVNKSRPKKTKRATQRACRQRQSRLWVEGRRAIGDVAQHKRVIDLIDRGGDTFEFLDFQDVQGYQYVVRSQFNRWSFIGGMADPSMDSKIKLHNHLRSLMEEGRRPQEVRARPAKPKEPAVSARTTEVAIAWAEMTLPAPSPGRARGEHRQGPLTVWVVRVWEVSPPVGVKGLEWLLLTNVAVTDAATAWERVDWYEQRWPAVEEFHKAQKTGCTIEGPQFTTLAALRPMIGLLSVVAWYLLHLRWLARSEATATEPAVQHVPELWVEYLSRWRYRGEARLDWTIHEFLLALARLGGHQNRKGDGFPGWQTIWKGWVKLRTVFELTPPPLPEKSDKT